MDSQEIENEVRRIVSEFSLQPEAAIDADTQLIGQRAILKSRQLVEVLLAVEEFAETALNVEFDWRSDSALSASRSVFRTVGVMANHLHQLQTKA